MQTRIRQKLGTKFSKIEVLLTFWDKMVGYIHQQASDLKDEETINMMGQILLVPEDVKIEVLKVYLIKCMQLHSIAFFQWRLKFPNTIKHDPQQLEDIISDRVDYFSREFESMNKMILTNSKFDEKKLGDYNLVQEPNTYLISSFESVGLPDPFPRKETANNFPEHGYPSERYCHGTSPSCIYIPTKQLMIKIMRACIEVKTP